ncbi:hypothetical protein SAMN05444395_11016 [Flavobacterium fryxellicola]|nr:hypothetical protein SAMN05444395_11016 [Flavobacterium fryxellicola]
MADAGAPGWGRFDFTIGFNKKETYSTLHLILFAVSAKDHSRQHKLIIPPK